MFNKFTYIIEEFSGFNTLQDRSKLPPGACIDGENVRVTKGGKIGLQKAKQLFSDPDTSAVPTTSSGVIISRENGSTFVFHAGTVLYYYNTQTETVEELWTGLTDGAFFGFTQSSENTEYADFLYMGNANDDDARWNGAHASIDGALAGGETEVTTNESLFTPTKHFEANASSSTTTAITMSASVWNNDQWNDNFYVKIVSGPNAGDVAKITDTTSTVITFDTIAGLSGTPTFEIVQPRFDSSGSLVIGGTEFTYTAITGDKEFSGCSGTPAAADGAAIAQAVERFPLNPKGNIHRMLDGYRLLLSTKNSTVYRSKTFNPKDFTFGAPRSASEGDIIDVVDASGNNTGLAIFKGFFIVLKRDLVKPYRYSQDTSDILTADTQNMKLSLQCGATSPQGVIEVDNGVYSCVTGRGIRALASTSDVVDSRTINLSYDITPTIEEYDLDNACAAFVFDRVFISCASEQGGQNDTTFVFNFEQGFWEPPIPGWGFSSFFFWNGGFYGTSASSKEIYRLYNGYTETRGEDEIGVQARWTTPYLNMGMPGQRKKFNAVLLEGGLAKNTSMTVRILYEHLGVEGSAETVISGTDDNIILQEPEGGSLGLEPLAVEPLGSYTTEEGDVLNKFRVILTTQEKPFYECYMQFLTDGIDQQFEISRIGFNVIEDPEHDKTIKKALN